MDGVSAIFFKFFLNGIEKFYLLANLKVYRHCITFSFIFIEHAIQESEKKILKFSLYSFQPKAISIKKNHTDYVWTLVIR